MYDGIWWIRLGRLVIESHQIPDIVFND